MIFGKKKIEAKELGRSIYYGLVRMPFSDPKNELSYKKIIYETLRINPSELLPKYHIIEIIAGILFGAQLAISEKFYFDATMDKINNGILEEMTTHFKELGFKASEVDELVSRCYSRVDEYFSIFVEGRNIGSSVMFVLGERFYWNIIGREERGEKLLVIATSASLKMVFAQQCVRKFLNTFKVI